MRGAPTVNHWASCCAWGPSMVRVSRGVRGIMGTRSRILANSGQAPSPIIPLVTQEMINKYTERALNFVISRSVSDEKS